MATGKTARKTVIWPWIFLVLLVAGGFALYRLLPQQAAKKARFVSVDTRDTTKTPRLPLAPHIHQLRARPDDAMIRTSAGLRMRFRLMDKRTLRIDTLVITVGEMRAGPWGGWIVPLAFAPDLMIRDGESVHGPEGTVNPAVWVELRSHEQKKFYEGWMFSRDTAQTAWDHPRYDLTFLGLGEGEGEGEVDSRKRR